MSVNNLLLIIIIIVPVTAPGSDEIAIPQQKESKSKKQTNVAPSLKEKRGFRHMH